MRFLGWQWSSGENKWYVLMGRKYSHGQSLELPYDDNSKKAGFLH